MRKVFLVSSNTTIDPYAVYPLGMAVLASALVGRGFDVRQFDLLAAEQRVEALQDALRTCAPDFVGLSLRNIDNTDSLSGEAGWYLARAKELVRAVRVVTNVPVIVGGPAFSILPEEILNYIEADYGVVGEGEQAFPDLLEKLERGESVSRITYAESACAGVNLPGPMMTRDLVEFYLGQSGMVNMQTKRGCPHNCAYCTYPSLEGNRFRPREPGAVADDVERLHKDFKVEHVFFTDSVFNDKQGHYLEVAEALARRELPVRWSAFFRPQGIQAGHLKLLKRSGLCAMELGTDAGCDTTLQALRKGFTYDDVFAVNQVCLEERVPVAHFVMFGCPGETPDTVRESMANMEKLGNSVVFAFTGIRILPGTRVLQYAIEENIISADHPLLKPVYYFSPAIDPESMNAEIEKAFQGNRLRLFPPSEAAVRMQVMQRFGYKGLLWDKLMTFA